MAIALLLLLFLAIAVGAVMLRGLPRRKQVGFAFLATGWTAIVSVIGYSIGGIGPQYRGDIALLQLLRETAGALDVGECERTRAAFAEADRLISAGGSVHEGAALVRTRLRGAADAPVQTKPAE